MRYFKLFVDTPYAGTDSTQYMKVDETEGFSENVIQNIINELCDENAGGFEYLINGWDEETTEEELEDYYSDCRDLSFYEEISEEEYLANAEEE